MLLEELYFIKMIKLLNMAEYCKVSKNVQLIQNFNNMAKLAIKITKNATLIKNAVEFLRNVKGSVKVRLLY